METWAAIAPPGNRAPDGFRASDPNDARYRWGGLDSAVRFAAQHNRRVLLAVLDALLTIEVKAGRSRVAQRVSYKALDVEQIGHCYEGLLDHGAVRIPGLSLGLVGPEGAEPEQG